MTCVRASSHYLPHAQEYSVSIVGGLLWCTPSCLPLPLLMSQIHIYAEYCGGLTCGHFEDPNPRGGECCISIKHTTRLG